MHLGVKPDPSTLRGCFLSDQQLHLSWDAASGMAARKGKDPLAGLERSQQPGPQGDAQFPPKHKYDEL